MKNVRAKKFKLKVLPIKTEPDSIYYIKPDDTQIVTVYVTDKNGVAKELKDEAEAPIINGTNLTYTAFSNQGRVNSDTGTNAIIPLADGSNAGLSEDNFTTAEKNNLSNQSGVNSGDQTSIVGISGTKAQFDSAVSDGNFLYVGDVTQYTDEQAQDAIGNSVLDTQTINLSYNDTTGQISADVKANSITENELSNTINISTFVNDEGYIDHTNLSKTQNPTNVIIHSDTGGDVTINLANGISAGVTENNFTSTEKNKLDNQSGINTGDNSPNTNSNAYADSKIVNTLTDGDTNHAPSSDTIYNYYIEDIQLLRDEASTGLTEFGGLSIGTPTSTFNVGDVKGWFIDSTTDPSSPTKIFASFGAQNNITVTNLAVQNVTYVGIDSSGTVIQSSIPLAPPQHRDIIRLGVIVHSNRVVVNAVNNQPNSALNVGGQLNDTLEALGVFNLSGNILSANGNNLNINKSSGTLFKAGSNFINDTKNPHVLSLSSLTAPTNIRYRLKDSTEYPNTSVIDPNNYDINQSGVLTAVPNTKYTIQRVFLFQSNLIRIQYGRSYYDSLDDARAKINDPNFETESNLAENGLMICALIVRKGCTDLTNTEQALFVPIERFGKPSETNTGSGLFRKQILNNSNSGLLSGGLVTVASGSTINITAGKGEVIDNATDPSNPSLIEVSWSNINGTAITNVATQTATVLYINSDGTLFQDNIINYPNPTYSRSKIFLGVVGHPSGSLTNVYSVPDTIISPMQSLSDFAKSIGAFSISGNKITKTLGNLTLNKSAGTSFFLNSNYQVDKTNPNSITSSSLTAPVLIYVKRNSFIGAVSSSISTSQYDNAGTLTAIPVNNYVTHRIWHQPSNNLLFFQYSQYTYSSFENAKIGVDNEDFIVPSPLSVGAYLVAVIITREGETNLDNSARSVIIPQGKFAGTGGGTGGVSPDIYAYKRTFLYMGS